jgi:hypothetical protein
MSDAHWRHFVVEKNGRSWARLDDARSNDMFWVAYRVRPLPDDSALPVEIFDECFWHQAPLPTFHHVDTGIVSVGAFAGGRVPTTDFHLVSIRGLHPPPEVRLGILSRLKLLLRAG